MYEVRRGQRTATSLGRPMLRFRKAVRCVGRAARDTQRTGVVPCIASAVEVTSRGSRNVRVEQRKSIRLQFPGSRGPLESKPRRTRRGPSFWRGEENRVEVRSVFYGLLRAHHHGGTPRIKMNFTASVQRDKPGSLTIRVPRSPASMVVRRGFLRCPLAAG
ncbi:hypothetical protein R1flu_016477 [Riccia fluitans]|uniref:Uncharacterized protein n=1 Tax=Riccia fluitans TaxID=41844 RepID=A0ABD1YMH1_9MARC